MPLNFFTKRQTEDQNSTVEKKKIGWSQRFFIFAAVMFLLGWASTGIMSNAKNLLDFSSKTNLPQQGRSNNNQDQSTVMDDASENSAISSVGDSIDVQVQSVENSNASQVDTTDEANPIPTAVLSNFDTQPRVDSPVNWGDWFCANCVAVPARVKLTHYWPPLGGDNCWSFYDDYCYSPTKSTVPWETVTEISAACPVPWLGSVVEIPALDRRFLCLDTGDKVVCKDGTCVVDVLTYKTYPWDGMEFDAIVYYPQVWVEPAPTFTPAATPDQ
jgi:hypothetical protein